MREAIKNQNNEKIAVLNTSAHTILLGIAQEVFPVPIVSLSRVTTRMAACSPIISAKENSL